MIGVLALVTLLAMVERRLTKVQWTRIDTMDEVAFGLLSLVLFWMELMLAP